MCEPATLTMLYLAATAVGTGVTMYGQDTAANQEEANAKFAADQAEADARAEQGAAQVEAERIRREGKRQRSKAVAAAAAAGVDVDRSEEHTSELQSLMRNSYAVFCLKKKTQQIRTHQTCPYGQTIQQSQHIDVHNSTHARTRATVYQQRSMHLQR